MIKIDFDNEDQDVYVHRVDRTNVTYTITIGNTILANLEPQTLCRIVDKVKEAKPSYED